MPGRRKDRQSNTPSRGAGARRRPARRAAAGEPSRTEPSTGLRGRILALLEAEGKPVSVRELARRLDLQGPARRELTPELRGLLEEGAAVRIRGTRIGLPERMNLVVGRLTCNPSGFGFVVPEVRNGSQPDVYVSAVNLKEALHGDRVVVRVERVSPKGPEGRIIRVLDRALVRLVGRYEDDGRIGGHVVPFDRRVLHELFIPPGEAASATAGQMVVAEITRPPTATRNPAGKVLDVLGRLEDPGVDLKVVMAKHELPEAFPPEVEAEAQAVPKEVTPDELRERTDFRQWATVTVDPETARDHDDAISLDRLPNGHWLLAVHIADVAHYVREGSLLDQEAYLRGTSVYFPERVVPMLPHTLSSHICSLVEGEDRLTQSVVMEIDARGKIRRTEFHDGVIRSAARMSYGQVQRIVDGDAELRKRYALLGPLFERMDELAKIMRRRRYERGALDLDLPEPKLVLGPSGEVTQIVAEERLDSMRMIEEFMLAANEAVAEQLSQAGVSALFRIHERPDPQKVEEFSELASSLGYRLPANLEAVRPEDFQLILRQIQGKPEQRLVSSLLLRTMKLARYHEENLGHFGLATEMYAHFTSPIRRYPDLVVHRALRALRRVEAFRARGAGEQRLPASEAEFTSAERAGGQGGAAQRPPAQEMGLHLSDRERKAAEAERELIEWKKVRFMADKVGEVYTGYVTGVQAFGLFVELEEIYVQGLVHVSSMSDDYYQFDEKSHQLKGENTHQVYRLGDKVKVQVARADLERRQLDFALVDVLERAARGAGRGRPPRALREERGRRGGRAPKPAAGRARRR